MTNEYAAVYGVIKLNQRDYDAWKKAYKYLDLDGELAGMERWAGEQDNWFWACRGLLAKRNRQAYERRMQKLGFNGIEGVL